MNKMWKKWISGISALAMFVSSGSALAAQITTDTNYWKQSFENLAAYAAPEELLVTVDDNADEAGAMDIAAAQELLEAGGVFVGSKGGLYGKAAEDGTFAVEQAGDFSGKIVMRTSRDTENAMRNKAGVKSSIGAGNFAHVSFEMAVSDYSFARTVQLTGKPTSKTSLVTMKTPVLAVNTDGTVNVFSSTTAYIMPQNKWVRYDLVFGDTENTTLGSYVDVYADGELIIGEKRFDLSTSPKYKYQLGGLEELIFNYDLGGASGTYIDNFMARKLTAAPEIAAAVLSHTDPEISGRIDNEAKNINLVSTTMVEEFLAGLNRTDVQVVTENGIPQNGAVVNGAVIVGSGDQQVYYTLQTYQQDFYVKAGFEDVSIIDAASLNAATGLTLSGTGALSVRKGLGARDAANGALQLETDGADAIAWTGAAIERDTVSLEESVMLAGDMSAVLTMTVSGQDYTLASWDADHTVQALGQATGTWRDYAWYKTVAVLRRETNELNIYINGELAATQALPAGGVERVALETAGDGILGLDDVFLHTGEYVPGTDDVVLTANNTNYIVSEEEHVIYIPADTTVDVLLENITVSDNAAFQGAYVDAAMTQETAAAAVADGNYVVFASKVQSVYEAYEIRVTDGAQGILGVTIERMRYDNDAKTIFAPAYTKVKAFVDAVLLATGHVGTVVNAAGAPLADNDGIGMGTLDGNRFVVSYENGVNSWTNTYEILTTYAYAGFEDVYGEEIKPNALYGGFKYENQKNSGGEVTLKGVEDPAGSGAIVGQLTARPQSAQGDAQQVLQYSSMDLLETTKPFAIRWDIYNDSTTNGYNRIILTKTDSGGNSGYYTLFEMQNGNIKMCSGSVVATCQPDTWNRMILLFSPGGNGNCTLYVNGKSVYSGGTLFKAAASIQEFYFTSSVPASGRMLYYDNLAVYPISSAKDFDTTGMNSTVTSSYDILEKQTVSGYGPATAKQVMELFNYKDGAAAKMYAADGKTPVADDALAEAGMKMVVTSGNGLYTTMYTLAEPVRYTAPEILIGGRSVKYLVRGAATATAGVYSAYPLPMTLTLSYTDAQGAVHQAASRRPADHRGQFDFVTESAGTVQNVEGEKLTLTWTDDAGNAYAEPQEIVWTGQLDLSSEIAMVKNNAISIVTITQDDGDVGTLNKLNSWFAQYGLRGTSVLPSQDVKTASGANTYRKIFEPGYIDVTSHSESEANLGANPPTEEKRLRELKGSRDTLREVLGQEVLTFAPSNNVLDPRSQEVVREYYWAVRQGGEGYNSLDPIEGNGVGQWYNLRNMFNQKPKRQNGEACTLNETLDEVIKAPCWMIEMHHVINEKGQGTLPITDTEANSHFRKMGEMQDAGQIWVASFDEATKYIRERQHTEIEDVALDGSRVINLYTDGYLPADVFDYPLTIKSQVPDEWANTNQFVKVTQGGKVQSPEVTVVDGRLGIFYDAYPNGGPITIELVDEQPAVTLSEVKMTSEGELKQVAGSMEPVVFTASTVPAENVDTTGIQWFVNDVHQKDVPDGTLTFSFQAERAGVYTVFAKDAKSGFASKPLTVTLTEPGVLFEDDFDGYGDADILSDNWYTNAPVNLVENPKVPGDTVAAVGPNPTNTYPGMHQTVATVEGVPAAFTGSVLMVGGKQRFFLEARSSDQKVKKSVLEFMENGDVVFKGPEDVKIAKNPLGAWVHYAYIVTPAKEGELTSVRIVLNGPALLDADGQKQAVVVYETQVDQSGFGMVEQGSLNMVHNHKFDKTDGKDITYLNDIRIYNPQPIALLSEKADYMPDDAVTMLFNGEVYGFTTDMVTVTDAAGREIPVAGAEFDGLAKRVLKLTFDAPLQKGAQYVVSVSGQGMADVLGRSVEHAEGIFQISSLDMIESISIQAQGKLEQKKEAMSAVNFTAAAQPAENVDVNRIKWYVNDAMQEGFGTSSTFIPTTVGAFAITARDGDVISNAVTVTVLPPEVTGITLGVQGMTSQSVEAVSEVRFTANPQPNDAVLDGTKVVWYVDGREAGTGAAFAYTPAAELGEHSIYARLADTEIQSDTRTIKVLKVEYNLQDYFMTDRFEAHGPAGTAIHGNNNNLAPWTAALGNDGVQSVTVVKDPAGGENLAAQFVSMSGKQYPRLQRSGIALTAGKPVAITGKLYLANATSAFILEAVGTNRKEMVVIKESKVTVNGAAVDGMTYAVGEWMWFSAYVVPGENPADSTIRLALSNNAGSKTVVESPLNLSGVGLGTGKQIYLNTAIDLSKKDAVYVDDIKIYYPEAAFLIGKTLPTVGEDTLEISFNHDIASATFSADKVQITANGAMIQPAEVLFNPLAPDCMTVRLAEPVAEGVAYELWLDGGVEDISGGAVYGTLEFGKKQEPGSFTVTAAGTADGMTTVSIERQNMQAGETVKVYTAAYEGNRLAEVHAEDVNIEAGTGVQTVELQTGVLGDAKVFVWTLDMVPLWQ